MPNAELSNLVPLTTYREERQHIFPSATSLDWFLRSNRNALIDAGALLKLTGRWFASPSQFDSFMLDLGKAAAKAAATHAAQAREEDSM